MLAFRRYICRTLRSVFFCLRRYFNKSDFRGRYRCVGVPDDRRRKGLADKGLRYRVSTDEFISAAILLCAVGYGAVSISGEYPWFAVSTFTVMLSASLLGGFAPLLFAVIAALPPSLYYTSFTPLAVYALISLAPIAFSKYSPLLTAIGAVAIETALYFLTSAFDGMTAYQTFFLLAPCLIYAFIPNEKMKNSTKIAGFQKRQFRQI